jgi:Flp pilus assembly pilin Flp
MRSIRSFSAALARDQRGLSTVEYAIILCVIIAVAVGTWQTFGARIHESLVDSSTKIDTALTPAPP